MAAISNLEKEIFKSIGDHSIPTDLILKNRKLFGKVKKCRVKILRLPKGKLTTKKRFNLGRIPIKKAEEGEIIRKGKLRQKNKKNRITKQIEQENLDSQSIEESPSKIRSRRKTSSLPFVVKDNSIEKNKSFNNSKRKNSKDIDNEKIKFTKEQVNKVKKASSEINVENGPSKAKRTRNSLEEVETVNSSQENLNSSPDSKTRKRSTNADAKDNTENKVHDDKSLEKAKSKRHSNSISNGLDKSKKIFIKFSTINPAQSKKEKNSILVETKKPDNSSKNIKLLNRTYMIKKFGIRFFNSYVKVKREYLDKAAVPTIKEIIKTKRNNKSVSFSETVEVFGESDTADDSEPEKEKLEADSNTGLFSCDNSHDEELNQEASPMEVIDVERFCSLKVIDTLSPNSRTRKQSNDSEISKHQNDEDNEVTTVEEHEDNIQETEKEDFQEIIENDHLDETNIPENDIPMTPEKTDSDTLDTNQSKSSEQSEYKTPEKEDLILKEEEEVNPKEDDLIAVDKEALEEVQVTLEEDKNILEENKEDKEVIEEDKEVIDEDNESSNSVENLDTRKFDSPIPGRPPIRRLVRNLVLDSDSDSNNSRPATSAEKLDPSVPINTDITAVAIDSDDSDTFLAALKPNSIKSIAEETDSVLLFDKLKSGAFDPDENLPTENLISSRKSSTNSSYTGMAENLLLTDDNDILSGNIEKVQAQGDHEDMDVFADAENYFNESEKINDALKEGSGNEFLTSLSLLDNEPAKSSFDIDQ